MFNSKKTKIRFFFSIGIILPGIVILGITILSVTASFDSVISALTFDSVDDNPVEWEDWDEMEDYPATYVGVDDKDTIFSKKILREVKKWNNGHNPFYDGYHGLCELWCADTYRNAGYFYAGACCAHSHKMRKAKKDGFIPKGALIFSGMKPDGSYYENDHRPSAFCPVCHNWAGHVAIYIGGGNVVGSQVPYVYSIDSWIRIYGYGGWSLE